MLVFKIYIHKFSSFIKGGYAMSNSDNPKSPYSPNDPRNPRNPTDQKNPGNPSDPKNPKSPFDSAGPANSKASASSLNRQERQNGLDVSMKPRQAGSSTLEPSRNDHK